MDYWLNRYEKNLVEIKDRENLTAIYAEDEVNNKIALHSFKAIKVIGRGGFSRVLEVRHRSRGDLFAMKTISKAFIESKGKVS